MPVVSICCITYQHVNFIRDAIEGFLMQETTFPVEIFIHDDASTDGTAEIVKEYAEKYPKLFWTVLQTENQWSKGAPNSYFFGLIQKQRGEFIALCEGDDYWIAKEKLQKQVNLLDDQKNLVGCCHEVLTNIPSSKTALLFNSYSTFGDSKNIRLKHLLSSNWLATCSVLVRKKSISNLPDLLHGFAMGDWPMWIWATNDGAFLADPQPMGFYRCHAGGVWSSLDHSKQLVEIIKMLSGISHLLENKYEEDGINGILDCFCQLVIRAFLGSENQGFKVARKHIETSAWNQKKFMYKLSMRISESQLLGVRVCGTKSITDSIAVCLYLKKSFKLSNEHSMISCKKLAISLTSQAWVNKINRPFFGGASLMLSMLISFPGTLKALFQMGRITKNNLRTIFEN